jgi:hypothetical protein
MHADDLRKKLEPSTIRAALLRAGMLLTGWELLQNDIEAKVRDFFLTGFDERGLIYDEEAYNRNVRARHKHVFEASLLWLVDLKALSPAQATRVREMREHRNKVAHQLPTLLVDPEQSISVEVLREMKSVLRALAIFWGRIEIDTNPDYDGREVDDDHIHSGSSLLMLHLIEACELSLGEDVEPTPSSVSNK